MPASPRTASRVMAAARAPGMPGRDRLLALPPGASGVMTAPTGPQRARARRPRSGQRDQYLIVPVVVKLDRAFTGSASPVMAAVPDALTNRPVPPSNVTVP
jgi:hypothetical protein